MGAQRKHRPSELVQRLIESLGGEMKYHAGGGPGGFWELKLKGKTTQVEVRDNRVNKLDHLYVAKVDNPQTWDDYESPGRLVDDAFWRLVGLFPW